MWLPEVLMCASNRYLHIVSTCLNQVYPLQELEHANHHGSNLPQFKHNETSAETGIYALRIFLKPVLWGSLQRLDHGTPNLTQRVDV